MFISICLNIRSNDFNTYQNILKTNTYLTEDSCYNLNGKNDHCRLVDDASGIRCVINEAHDDFNELREGGNIVWPDSSSDLNTTLFDGQFQEMANNGNNENPSRLLKPNHFHELEDALGIQNDQNDFIYPDILQNPLDRINTDYEESNSP